MLISLLLQLAAAGPHARESRAMLHEARVAQAGFERVRRWNLPMAFGGGKACEHRIGRICYWYDRDDHRAPPEPARIRRKRDTLLAVLARAAALVPEDAWVAGQRVRYLAEAGRAEDAVNAARACRAPVGTDDGWCDMLVGLALHAAEEYERADSAFLRALDRMPREERCQGMDLSPLLEGEMAESYNRSDCESRRALDARIWWLADPLWSVPGNDRRTEHFARVTMARLHQDAASPYQMAWGDDLRELIVRYGWATYWTREATPTGAAMDARVVGHEPVPSYSFFPSPRALERPVGAALEDWTLDSPTARERYAPPYALILAAIPHQAALFRRGDSAIVVAGYELDAAADEDSHASVRSRSAALVLVSNENDPPIVSRLDGARAREVLVARAPAGQPLLLSLEVVDQGGDAVARARHALSHRGTGDRVSVSDVLLFNPSELGGGLEAGAALPATLPEIVPAARRSSRVRKGATLGLYWEVYGLHPMGEIVAVSLRVSRTRRGWVRRAAESVGITRTASLRMQWLETSERGAPFTSRALAIDLAPLGRGSYRLELSLRVPGQAPAMAARDIEVIGR